MMRKTGMIALLAALLVAGTAEAAKMSAQDKAVLEGLSPQLREQVMARAADGNTVMGVLETMLLNRISELYSSNEVVVIEADFVEGMATVQTPSGQPETVYFEAETLMIKN